MRAEELRNQESGSVPPDASLASVDRPAQLDHPADRPASLDRSADRPASLDHLAERSVAVVHEWFGATGGSENVFRRIAAELPHAERFVLWKDAGVPDPDLRESWLARTPLRRTKAVALPVMPLVWRTLSRQRFDVVVSSSHAFAHTVRLGAPDRTRYLSYVHSPARYLWSPSFDGRGANPLLAPPRRLLQAVDLRLSRHVHSYAANSREVRDRIRRYWRRDAVVVNPPVDTDFFSAAPEPERQQSRDYLLGVGRWIPYKNFDLIIAIAEAARFPLVVAGSGPEEANLRRAAARAGVSVRFEIQPDRERLRQLYWGAKALLFPVHEDFGIIPVEAQACGTPVLGLRRGGLRETVVDGETGLLVDSLTAADYLPLVRRLDELDRSRLPTHAAGFSHHAFSTRVRRWIAEQTA
ncbi:glycosyltransferase [Plantactinospora endophytica]|uniref:Glycosyl transferase n=1 Tax=Plantactinospora endophytica TaxID=673535 RepID=A0ABQ4EAR6_9ACTN|nr:glycosyltransferase [Plantactinospora endophytica]GIG91366.1 glycosyl transferase [Plantactinospora endophytica]